MKEKRLLERFELDAPGRLFLESGKRKKDEYVLTTRDVSSGGAYVYMSKALPEGVNVKLEFTIALDKLQKIAGEKGMANVKVKGKVVRSDGSGIAIKFGSGCKITAVENSASHYNPVRFRE